MVTNRAGNINPRELPVGASVSLNPMNAGISRDAWPIRALQMTPTAATIIMKYRRKELK